MFIHKTGRKKEVCFSDRVWDLPIVTVCRAWLVTFPMISRSDTMEIIVHILCINCFRSFRCERFAAFFPPSSYHGRGPVSISSSGWNFYRKRWWEEKFWRSSKVMAEGNTSTDPINTDGKREPETWRLVQNVDSTAVVFKLLDTTSFLIITLYISVCFLCTLLLISSKVSRKCSIASNCSKRTQMFLKWLFYIQYVALYQAIKFSLP